MINLFHSFDRLLIITNHDLSPIKIRIYEYLLLIENPYFVLKSLQAAEFFIQGRSFLILAIEFVGDVSTDLSHFIFVNNFIRLIRRSVEVK